MLNWVDRTDSFSEESRHWNGLYMEICEVALDVIECSLFSNEDGDWEIFFQYGIMHGVSYAPAEQAPRQREQMMRDIANEYSINGMNPSKEFVNTFCRKYKVDVLHAFFK